MKKLKKIIDPSDLFHLTISVGLSFVIGASIILGRRVNGKIIKSINVVCSLFILVGIYYLVIINSNESGTSSVFIR